MVDPAGHGKSPQPLSRRRSALRAPAEHPPLSFAMARPKPPLKHSETATFAARELGRTAPDAPRIIHLFPTYGRRHDTSGRQVCWCLPEPEIDRERILVRHRSDH